MGKKVFVLLLVVLALFFVVLSVFEEELAEAEAASFYDGYEEGYDAGHKDGFEEGYYYGYADGEAAPSPLTKPTSGAILAGIEGYESEITVKADSDYDYVVSLKTPIGEECVCFYVRAGDTVTVGVPAKHLYVYFACGKEWYGYGKGLMFGENTAFSKDDEMLDFTEYTWEYTLQPITGGNFTETPSNESEFFQ